MHSAEEEVYAEVGDDHCQEGYNAERVKEDWAAEELDPTDIAAIEKVYTDMEARVESINVSFVMKVRE